MTFSDKLKFSFPSIAFTERMFNGCPSERKILKQKRN